MVHVARTRARDDLAEMFCKRMVSVTKLAKAELAEIREREAEISERLIISYRSVLGCLDPPSTEMADAAAAVRRARRIVEDAGGFDAQLAEIEAVSAHHANNYICAARRLVVSPAQPAVIRRKLLGPMAYPDPQGERDKSMPGNRRSCPGVRGDASWDTRVIWRKLHCLNPNLQKTQCSVRRKDTRRRRHALRQLACRAFALRSVELCPVRAIKEMSGAPKSRSDVQQGRTRDQPSRREPQGDGMPVVVVEVTTHQGGRESRSQGKGA